jgi:hypothetical protein
VNLNCKIAKKSQVNTRGHKSIDLRQRQIIINYYYYYYYNSSIALNLKQYYSKRFTVHKIQYNMYNKTYIKNWHNEIKISNWKTSPNQKVYIQHIEF